MTMQPAATAYDASLFQDNFPWGVEAHFWFKARNAMLDRSLREVGRQGLVPPAPAILEVGCGTGIVVADMRRRGHDIRGVELGVPLRSLAPHYVTTGIEAHALAADARVGIDILMFLDVLEHVPDDVELLRRTLAAFPRCRCVIVTVPARPEVWSSHDTYYGHYRRYTRRTLRSSLRAAGLVPRQTRYAFRSLYAAAGGMKLLGRDREPVMQAPAHRRLHGVLASGLALEDRLLGALPIPGLSLLAVATVPGRG